MDGLVALLVEIRQMPGAGRKEKEVESKDI